MDMIGKIQRLIRGLGSRGQKGVRKRLRELL